ncbi:LysR family transcriptional regulator [Nocardia sp. NBC_01388]|uniref:LysR family transcriptional regulator n=1 Tax=Nocardia sp. NBC_01388 TaxID=2903596 RepID=UPI00324FDB1A
MDTDRIDLTELEIFLTLAEELHFGRTATRLGLSQPRVSQLLRALERRVGGLLFERTSRRVMLNPLGERLLRGLRPAFTELQRVVADTRSAAQGIRIGFLGPYISTLAEPIARHRTQFPDCPLELVQVPWTDVFGALYRSEIDIQLCLAPVEQPGLVIGPEIGSFPRMLAISKAHPRANAPVITLEDLAELPVIGPSPQVPPELARTFWPPALTPTGRPIPRLPAARTEPEMLGAVAHNNGVFLTTSAMPTHFSHPDVQFIPFTGMPDARVVLVWRKGNDDSKVRDFAKLATRALVTSSGSRAPDGSPR